MDSSCICDSSDLSSDPTEYLEALKKKYLDRTAKLQFQQQELEKRIMHMEIFLGEKENDNSGISTCSCDNQAIPKVFPDTPVRDVPGMKVLQPIKSEQQSVVQTCSFFQKIMENARSILSIKCQCASAFVSAKSTSVTVRDAVTTSEFTPTDPPTREKEVTPPNIVEDDTTATDQSSKTSICTCDDSNSTLQEASCSCHLEALKFQQAQQVSNDPSSSTPYKDTTKRSTDSEKRGKPAKDCAFNHKDTTSEITSSCSCEECVCMADDKVLPYEAELAVPIPKITVFSGKSDNIVNAEVQATKTVESRGLNMDVSSASKGVSCCPNRKCPLYKRPQKDVVDNVHEGIQVFSTSKDKAVHILTPTETASVACCRSEMCPSNLNLEKQCEASCNTIKDGPNGPKVNITAQSTQYQVNGSNELYFDACFEKCQVTRQDGQNQCAFVGSPLLKPLNFDIAAQSTQISGSKLTPTLQGTKKVDPSAFSLTSEDLIEMQNITELAKKEKQMKAQIQNLQKREQQYQEVTRNMDTYTTRNPPSRAMQEEIQKISQELRLENQYLKSELMDLKVELKHCIEKVEGPMKQKLQTEKQKCEVLQSDLQQASKNMLLSQDAYSREMNQLKLQLCCACANITELNQMNERLKDEMGELDCLCAKLEDDLVKQKINEADTIKRLTSRRLSGDGPLLKQSSELSSSANLDAIARKLSKSIKELAPCDECSSLPPELAGAARCIKELTDLVRKRRNQTPPSSGCNCAKQPSKQVSIEDCCSCCVDSPSERSERKETAKSRKKTTTPSLPCECQRYSKPSAKSVEGARDAGGEEKAVRTLLSVPDNFVQKGISSKFNVDVAASSYYSTTGEPTRDGVPLPCSKIASPGLENKGTITIRGGINITQKSSTRDESLMCQGLENKGTVTMREAFLREEGIQKDLQQEDEPIEKASKKSLPCSHIGEPCKKKSKGDVPKETTSNKLLPYNADVTTETKISTAEIGMLADESGYRRATPSMQKDISQISHEIVNKILEDDSENAPTSDADRLTSRPMSSGTETDTGPLSDSQILGGKILTEREKGEPSKEFEEMTENRSGLKAVRIEEGPGEEDKEADNKLSQFTTEYKGAPFGVLSKERPPSGEVRIPGQEIPVEEERVGEFPVDVVVKAYALDEPPDGLHITTTVTASGTLEVITEGPGGIIETTMTYTIDGNIEVVTEMTEYEDQKSTPTEQVLEKYTTEPTFRVAGVPEESSMEKTSGFEFDDPNMSDKDAMIKPKLKPIMPIESSKFSGPSGPETETAYTPSTTSGEVGLTSKLGTGSYGIEAVFDVTPDLTGDASVSKGITGITKDQEVEMTSEGVVGVQSSAGQQPLGTIVSSVSGAKGVRSEGGTTPSAQDAIRQDIEAGRADLLASEGVTSTGADMPSGEVFTPDQNISDVDEDLGVRPMGIQMQTAEIQGFMLSSVDSKPSEPSTPAPTPAEMQSIASVGRVTPKSAEFGTLTGIDDQTSAVPTLDGAELPGTSRTGPPKTRDCGCQSKDQKDQSCQCCECKTIGITTSGDKETITAEREEMCKTPQEQPKTDTDSEFVTTSEVTDNAFTQRPESSRKPGENSKLGMPIKDCGLILNEQMLEKHPELAGKTSEEQQKLLAELGYLTSKDKMIQALLNEYPELLGKSPEEQSKFLEEKGYSKALLEQIQNIDVFKYPEQLITSHPEHAGISQRAQEIMFGGLVCKSSISLSEIDIDNDMLAKHPELVGKDNNEQQEILKSLGYIPIKASQISTVNEDLIKKHPELAGKSYEQQQQLLQSLGYAIPNIASVIVDKTMLEKHPELAGKSSQQQKEILKNLGYTIPQVASVIVDQAMLEKHPELIGKTPEQQEQILENLGYKTPKATSVVIDKIMLEKYPELIGKSREEQEQILKDRGIPLQTSGPGIKFATPETELIAGKSPEQQQKILEDLGYETPNASVIIDENIIKEHPELVGKSLKEQQKILDDLGYKPKQQEYFDAHESIVKDEKPKPSRTCKAPCATKKSPQRRPSDVGSIEVRQGKVDEIVIKSCKAPCATGKSPQRTPPDVGSIEVRQGKVDEIVIKRRKEDKQVIKIDKPHPSLKEVSITCRAPCRSAATIHDDSLKTSEKEFIIGDASTASRSVSLQKKPSSRDGSSSCKASCRTISVQSRTAQVSKDVQVLETARIESTSTASSSDREKEKDKEKNKKKEKIKSKPGEVPSIVSQLSDKDRPVIEPTKKSRAQRKKRSARLVPDCLKCTCEDPCTCEVCSYEKMGRRQRKVNRPVRSCDCPSPVIASTIAMASSMPLPSTSHANSCGCNQSVFNPFTCHPELNGRSPVEGEFLISDENDGNKLTTHSSKCECVDCLCLPKIKKLAETREYPIVYDRKQIYHLKTTCATCTNAQNARKYIEQQQRSRIPISTSTANPPKVKSDSKPVASMSKVDYGGQSSKSPGAGAEAGTTEGSAGTGATGGWARPEATGAGTTGGWARPEATGAGTTEGWKRPEGTGAGITGGWARPEGTGGGTTGGWIGPGPPGGSAGAGATGAETTGGWARPEGTGAGTTEGWARPEGTGARTPGGCAGPGATGAETTGVWERPEGTGGGTTGGWIGPGPPGGSAGAGATGAETTGGWARPEGTGAGTTGGWARPEGTGAGTTGGWIGPGPPGGWARPEGTGAGTTGGWARPEGTGGWERLEGTGAGTTGGWIGPGPPGGWAGPEGTGAGTTGGWERPEGTGAGTTGGWIGPGPPGGWAGPEGTGAGTTGGWERPEGTGAGTTGGWIGPGPPGGWAGPEGTGAETTGGWERPEGTGAGTTGGWIGPGTIEGSAGTGATRAEKTGGSVRRERTEAGTTGGWERPEGTGAGTTGGWIGPGPPGGSAGAGATGAETTGGWARPDGTGAGTTGGWIGPGTTEGSAGTGATRAEKTGGSARRERTEAGTTGGWARPEGTGAGTTGGWIGPGPPGGWAGPEETGAGTTGGWERPEGTGAGTTGGWIGPGPPGGSAGAGATGAETTGGWARPDGTGAGTTGGWARPEGTGAGTTGGWAKPEGTGAETTGGWERPEGTGAGTTGGWARPEGTGAGTTGGLARPEGTGGETTGGWARPEGTGAGTTGGWESRAGTTEDWERPEGTGAGTTGGWARPEGTGAETTGGWAKPEGTGPGTTGGWARPEGTGAETTGGWARPEGTGAGTTGGWARPEGTGAGATGAGQLSTSDSIYNSISCDCQVCKCTDCPDPKRKSSRPEAREYDNKNEKGCCCRGPCTCKPCTVNELTRKLQEAQQKLASSGLTPFSTAISGLTPFSAGISGLSPLLASSSRGGHELVCTCSECICPSSDLNLGAHEVVCTCTECTCPTSDLNLMPGKDSKPTAGESASSQAMPGKDSKPTAGTSAPSQAMPAKDSKHTAGAAIASIQSSDECTCPECVTCPESDLIRKARAGGDQQIGGEPSEPADEEECTCPECVCAETDSETSVPEPSSQQKHPAEQAAAPPSKAEAPPSTAAAPPSQAATQPSKAEAPPSTAAAPPSEAAAPPSKAAAPSPTAAAPPSQAAAPPSKAAAGSGDDDCDCQVCACPGKTSLPPVGGADVIAECDCKDCVCSPCADIRKQKGRPRGIAERQAEVRGFSGGIDDCDCVDCKCSPCADPKKIKEPQSKGMGAKDSEFRAGMPEKILHPLNCDCDECLCLEEIIKSEIGKEHPEDCDCPVCVCPGAGDISGIAMQTASIKGFINQGIQPSMDKAVHPADCNCDECECPGLVDKAVHAPDCDCDVCKCTSSAEQATHALTCACPECLCPECTVQAVHVPGCRCDECLCQSCEYKATAGTGVSTFATEIVGVPSIHPGDCSCIKCVCDICSEPSKQKAAPHLEGCKCIECLCKECLLKLEPLKHDEGCKCPQCTCVECLRKMSAGDHLGADTQECLDTREVGKSNEIGENCACENCICIDCSGKKSEGIGLRTTEQSALESNALKPTDDHKCTCEMCQCEPCTSKEADKPCTCNVCSCVECNRKRDVGLGEREIGMGDKATDAGQMGDQKGEGKCDCLPACTCESLEGLGIPASRKAGGPGEIGPSTADGHGMTGGLMDPPPFEPPRRIDCSKCECITCDEMKAKLGLLGARTAQISGLSGEPPPFEVPVRIDCICNRCDCVFCNKKGPVMKEAAAQQSKHHPTGLEARTVSVQPSLFVKAPPSAAQNVDQAGGSMPSHCDCPTCTCNEGEIRTISMFTSEVQSGIASQAFISADTIELPKPTLDAHMTKVHPVPCNCIECHCMPCADPNAKRAGPPIEMRTAEIATGNVKLQTSVKRMDNVTLARSIQAANKENCECKEQIEEIKRTLDRIKCACTEAEYRGTQNIAAQMGSVGAGLDMALMPGKPFVKQASVFGQTMSGLKMALANLQAKCKAKDKMIEAMTGELEIRGDSGVFDKVLSRTQKSGNALDYDQAEEIKSSGGIQMFSTNILFGKLTADQSTAPCDLRCVASKGVEVRTHKHKKKKDKESKRSSAKKLDSCGCSKPQIIQKDEIDCQTKSLTGFEVIDIRRITDDSLIVKWNPPNTNIVSGYDIFVNGTLSSKVMSGSRTSAMMHSLDLSKSVQITIYAVSKCGRIEPPAIAIYEIKR